MKPKKNRSRTETALSIHCVRASISAIGRMGVERKFAILTDWADERPRRGFFLPLSQRTQPISTALLIEELSTDSGPIISIAAGLLQTASIENWDQVIIDRHWARRLWGKSKLLEGVESQYAPQMIQKRLDFYGLRAEQRIGLDGEEKLFLTIGLYWNYWAKNDINRKMWPDDIIAIRMRAAISHTNLYKQCKYAGYLPLSAVQQARVDEKLENPTAVFHEMLVEDLGPKLASGINITINGIGPDIRDFVVEQVLRRKLKSRPAPVEVVRELLRRGGP